VPRDVLPELPEKLDGEEDFYYADLVGLAVELTDGTAFGSVKAVHDFGAGDLLELQPLGLGDRLIETIMVPFNRDAVPVVDVANGRLVITDPTEGEEDDDRGK